jgi:hypothetical protein
MDPSRLMTQPATITPRHPADDPDEYNDEVLEDGDPIELDGTVGTGVLLQQSSRTENINGANVVVETLTLFLPIAVAFGDRDAITVDGVTYEADGPPAHMWNPRLKRYTHVEASVKRIA